MEIGFNLPAFLIALVITAILVVGIQESATFNAGIVFIKVAVVLFIIALGFKYVNRGNWGHDWHTFAPMGFSGIGAGAAYIFFAYIGFDAVSTTAQEAKNPQRDLPIGIIASLSSAPYYTFWLRPCSRVWCRGRKLTLKLRWLSPSSIADLSKPRT